MTKFAISATIAAGMALAGAAHAATPVIGSSNVVDISAPVTLPDTTPCTVRLFGNVSFGANPVAYSFTPPAACPGPWAKVVLQSTFQVDAGRQYDRTATIALGGVNLLFGTTAEPRSALAPSWTVQRDVTEDSALFKTAQAGEVLALNYQDSTDTSTIHAGAVLLFYPADAAFPAPAVPDMVIPLAANAQGDTVALANGTQTLAYTGTLPRNILQAKLQVYLQSQNKDEFWYTCVPDNEAAALQNCGGGSFREGQISVDGVPAGVTPIYPWIYTGGIDPYLWEPIPGVQTLAFEPYHANLNPFAGVMDDGQPHTVAVSVYGANDYFSAVGALYLTLDKSKPVVTGAVTSNTLGAPAPKVVDKTSTANGATTGTLTTTSSHGFKIVGYVVGSAGKVTTAVEQTSDFVNKQTYDITDSDYMQKIYQVTTTNQMATRTDAAGHTIVTTRMSQFPLLLNYEYAVNSDNTSQQIVSVNQVLNDKQVFRDPTGAVTYLGNISEQVKPNDTLSFDAAGNFTGHAGSSYARLHKVNTRTGCTERAAASQNSVLTYFDKNAKCDPALSTP